MPFILYNLGYLSYDWEQAECYIPNREVAQYIDNLLLVGINYDQVTKQHTCHIEKYA